MQNTSSISLFLLVDRWYSRFVTFSKVTDIHPKSSSLKDGTLNMDMFLWTGHNNKRINIIFSNMELSNILNIPQYQENNDGPSLFQQAIIINIF